MLLSFYQLFLINDIELHMIDTKRAHAFEKRHHIEHPVLARQKSGIDLHVQKRALNKPRMLQLRHRFQHRAWPVEVGSAAGAYSIRQWLPRFTTGRQRAYFQTKGGITGNRENTGRHFTKFTVILFNFIRNEGKKIGGHVIHFRIIIAVFRSVAAEFPYLFKTGEVPIQSLKHFSHRDRFSVINDVFDCRYAIDQIGNADANDTVARVVLRASPSVIFGTFDALFKRERKGRNRTIHADIINEMTADNDGPNGIGYLTLNRVQKLIKGIKRNGIACLSGNDFI